MADDVNPLAFNAKTFHAADHRIQYHTVQILYRKHDLADLCSVFGLKKQLQGLIQKMIQQILCGIAYALKGGKSFHRDHSEKLVNDGSAAQKRRFIRDLADQPLVLSLLFAYGILDEVRILFI